MKVDTFFQNFELLTDAPNAVVKMQEIIMHLAFSGKLTKRDISDVKVNYIFREIKFERKRLLEETTFREPKDFKPIHHNEILFELPKEWMWTRIGELFLISSGTTPNRTNHKYFEDGTEYWVKTDCREVRSPDVSLRYSRNQTKTRARQQRETDRSRSTTGINSLIAIFRRGGLTNMLDD